VLKGASPNPPVAAPTQSRFGTLFDKLQHVKGALVAIAGVGAVLSGLVGYWTTYQTVKVGVPSTTVTAASATAGPLSIVVLPFSNQTGDPQKAYIADGLTTSVTSDLSRIRDAFVIPPTTAFLYRDKPASAQQLGRDVGVRFVLQGSVITSGEKARINATLADTQSGAQLWTETFDGDLTNLFALQDLITTRIGNSIGREMVIQAARESETRKSSPQVADLIMRARSLRLKPQSLKNWQQIETLSRQVLALEANNVTAMLYLATSLVLQPISFGSGMDESVKEQKYVEGRNLALRAKEIDPDNPSIYIVLGSYAGAHGDFAGNRRAAERWLSLEPKNPIAYNFLASTILNNVEPKRAIELLTQAINLEPKHPYDSILITMGFAYFMLGDDDAAIEWYLKSLEGNPARTSAHALLAMAYALKGDDAKARIAVAELRQIDPTFRLPDLDKPMPSRPAAYKDWFAKVYLPAWRKAGLPE